MPKYPKVPNRYPHMTSVREGIPKWSESLAKHPAVFDSSERHNNHALFHSYDIDFRFFPFPVLFIRNPFSPDDECPQDVMYQWSVVADNEVWQHYSDVIDFSNNSFGNPTIKTESNQGFSWNNIFPMFHVDWRCNIYKVDSNFNVQTIKDYRYDATDRDVYIYIEPRNKKQKNIWIESCLEYKEKHNCNLYINDSTTKSKQSPPNRDFTYVNSPEEVEDMYSSFYIGYGDKNIFGYGLYGEYGFFDPFSKYLGKDKIGFNPFGSAVMYSAANPRDPEVLSDEQISGDILGLSDWDIVNGC
tara:strand:- start:1144 stop:2043 length:900 start_codon:yes stop_codon:yes gene_type:complete